ncbi:SDR family NAD(P)-dependent oxidoreductase [Novosphingobium sp. BL-52-GroH]|uniref:SDR family NAD(P)-dependent oxidoreductase n=1 Tax=Novosphingobium sp. BL-52-GroH TaxID=3349877 RepID=UPI00384AC4E4
MTGSTRGIGRAIAEGLIAQGARVVISSEDAADTARVVDELSIPGIAADATSDNDLAELAQQARTALGGIDILVCNAGITRAARPLRGYRPG